MSIHGKPGLYSRIVSQIETIRCLVRIFHFRRLGMDLGEKVHFYGPVSITWPQNVKVGAYCTLNRGVHLGGRGGIEIGNGCRLSANAFLETGYLQTKPSDPDKRQHAHRSIRLGDNVWVGAGATILAGVEIGDHAVIAAGSVVTKNVPARHIAKGIPATCNPLPSA